ARPRTSGTEARNQRTTVVRARGSHRRVTETRRLDPCRGARRRGSLAEAFEVVGIAGEVARTALELSDAAAAEIERRDAAADFPGDELQPPAHELGVALARFLFQALEARARLRVEARVDVSLHDVPGSKCSTYDDSCATRRRPARSRLLQVDEPA